MHPIQTYIAQRNQGVDLVASCADLSEFDLLQMGMDPLDAAEMATLIHVYCGPTAFTQRQRAAAHAARALGHSLAVLVKIERFVARAKGERAGWALREELCGLEADRISKVANARLREMNPPAEPAAGMQVTRRAEGKNMTVRLTGSSLVMSDLVGMLDGEDPIASLDALLTAASTPAASCPADSTECTAGCSAECSADGSACACEQRECGCGEPCDGHAECGRSACNQQGNAHHDPARHTNSSADASVSLGPMRPVVHTNVIIHLDQLAQIVDGNGDDIQLRLTNGATMTGAEFVARTLGEYGFVTLVSPVSGPVNLYRTERFASCKQRIMLGAETTTCAWPGCRKPVDECQVHHLVAWQDGGQTNIANLVPLCAYHNGVNDDAAAHGQPFQFRSRGFMARVSGRVAWMPPWHGPPRFTGNVPGPPFGAGSDVDIRDQPQYRE